MLKRVAGCTFLAVVITTLPGCSLMITGAGIRAGAPGTRELVYEEFGRPQRISTISLLNRSTGETREFEVEHYLVHAKFAPKYPTGCYPLSALFAEPIYTPIALFSAVDEIVEGHALEFVYDDEGNTIGFRYPIAFMGRPASPEHRIFVGEWTDPSQPENSGGSQWIDWRHD